MSGIQNILLGTGSGAAAVDPYFYSVTSLLHGDGTNGAQNNTFLDSSTNNFTITRNGNTTQGSFSPFSQTGWSNYFDGSGDYLTVPDNAAFDLGSGAFTLECFAYLNARAGAYDALIGQWNNSSDSWLLLLSGNTIQFFGNGALAKSESVTITTGQWYHFACTRDGSNNLRLYANGVKLGSDTAYSTTLINSTANPSIGCRGDGIGTTNFNGYLSSVRVIKGGAEYTGSTYTVPTAPLTAIPNTSLLTCQANRFLDASSNAFAITRNGDVSVQPFSPFNPLTPYSTSAVGGSGYFDGSGDYLNTTTNISAIGTGDFTLEVWCYPTASTSYRYFLAIGPDTNFATGLFTGGYAPYLYAGSFILTSSISTVPNAWNHVQYVRSSGTLTVYVNGVSGGSVTWTGSIAAGKGYIGANDSNLYYFFGYHSSLRFSNIARSATVPTAPYTSDANTQLLLNYTNAGIFDNAAVADYETVGNAQISTSVKKYGTGSMSFDGTGDYLVSADSEAWNFGAGDFTAEAWIYPASFANEPMIMGQWSGDLGGTGLSWALMFSSGSTGYLRLITSSNGSSVLFDLSSSPYALSLNTWYHIAAVRIGTTFKLFVNGNQVATTTNSSALYNATNALTIGSESNTQTQYFNGYIDDLRISKGVARYPYNFTPPTAEFPNIGGTVTLTADPYFYYTTLLLPGNGTNGAQNNTFLDSSTNNFTITRNGNTTQGTFSPFSQTGWGNYFDGSGDSLTLSSNAAFAPGTGDFTVEAWIFPTAAWGTWDGIFVVDVTGGIFFGKLDTGFGLRAYATANIVSTTAPDINKWTHVAVSRAGTTVRLFINGALVASATNSQNFGQGVAYIGNSPSPGEDFPGYISNLRLVKGTAVYTADFTVPTTPLTAITNTSLLTCQANRFLDASSNAFAITRNGDVSIQAFSPFNPTAAWSAATNGGSGYFDGSGDYLSLADNAAFAMGTGNFTAEFWLYTADQSNNYPGILSASTYTDTGAISIRYDNTGNANKIFIYLAGASPSDPAVTSSAYAFGQWIHVAVIRDSSTALKIYVNGVLDGTATISAGQNVDFSGANSFYIGRGFDVDGGAAYYAGYITNVRLVKGQALASGNFTPPTAPVTASSVGWTGANAAGSITGTMSLLMSATNAGIYDATSKNDLETVGNAQISTTQSKFGGSSMYFDGTGDWLRAPSGPLTSLEGDFTAEGWVYLSSTAAAWPVFTVGDSNGSTGIELYRATSNGKWRVLSNNTAQIDSTTSTSTGSWVHLAVTRYSGVVRLFVNGINEGSTWSTTGAFSGAVYVGAEFYGGSVTVAANGYIQDLRITKGIARYTSNFTPPTTAFLTL